jgi:cell wall-associated NlpC family hydrolase
MTRRHQASQTWPAKRQGAGRDVTRLLSDFGHRLPVAPEPVVPAKESRLFHYASPKGRRNRNHGWAPAKAPVSTWRMTSDQAPVLWPFISTPSLPPTGAQMGIDLLSGGTFYADPHGWVLHDSVPVTNSNMFIFGKPGRGKSATVKALLLRMMDFGYRALILGDPKDEYQLLCRALGVEPFRIGPGLQTRINPLSFGPLGGGWDQLNAEEAQGRAAVVFGRWLTLVRGLVGSQRIGEHRVPFGPTDEVVVKAALQQLTGYRQGYSRMREITIPQLWQLLDDPTDDLVTECRYESRRHFLNETRMLRDALGQLVSGALAGLFDDHSTIDVDWRAPIQSLSLSRLEPLGDEAVGIALLCLNSWGRGMRELSEVGDLRIVVRDESWKQLRLGVEAVKSFDADLRLSRSNGDIQVAVGHKPSDPLSAGDVGSQAVAIAKDCTWPTSRCSMAKTSPSPKNSTDSSAWAPSPKTWLPAGPCTAKAVPCGASGNSCTKYKPCSTQRSNLSPTPTTPSKPPAEASVKKLLAFAAVIMAVIISAPLAVAVVVVSILAPAAVSTIDCGADVPAAATGEWRPPFQQRYTLTSAFGRRFHPIYKEWRLHTGQDLSSLPDAGPVVAASAGIVISADWDRDYGNIVSLRHGDGVVTRYGHLASIDRAIVPGARVSIGQRVAMEGSTGTSTGLHLHFQVEVNRTPVNPVRFMARRGAPLDGKAIAPSKKATSPASLGVSGDALEGGVGFPIPRTRTPRHNSLHNPPLPIPPKIKKLYVGAADKYKIPWTLLAGIGKEETGHGRNNHTSSAGAQGLMQFMPATWASMGVDGDNDHRADIHNDADSIYSAANYLTKSGVSQGAAGVRKALFAYNPINWYVNDVLYYAARYGGGTVLGDPNDCGPVSGTRNVPPLAKDRVAKVLAWAKDHDGDSYRMGATGPNVWDCSSFTQAAYAQIGIRMPRLASAQRSWLAAGNGIRIRPGQEQPGDLIFWDSYLGPNQIGHVMIVWNPANKTTIEARGTRAGVGHFSYANGPRHRTFEIWRVGNLVSDRR